MLHKQDAERKTKLKTAHKMLVAGYSPSDIKLLTELEEEDLANLSDDASE